MRTVAYVLTLALTAGACASSNSSQNAQSSQKSPNKNENSLYSLTLMRQGSQYLQQGRYDAALEKFQEANVLAPGNATVFNMLGLCHLRLGQYDQALNAFTTSINLVPAFTDAVNNRGATYLAMGQYRMAEVDFTSVLTDSTYPHRWDTHYNLGMTYLQQDLNGAAEENFRKSISTSRPVYGGFIQLAELAQLRGSNEEAILLLEEATLKFPSQPDAALRLGRLLVLLGRSEEAIPHLQQVIDSNPGTRMATEAQTLLESP